jgi:hypothetical protein
MHTHTHTHTHTHLPTLYHTHLREHFPGRKDGVLPPSVRHLESVFVLLHSQLLHLLALSGQELLHRLLACLTVVVVVVVVVVVGTVVVVVTHTPAPGWRVAEGSAGRMVDAVVTWWLWATPQPCSKRRY